MNRRKLLSVGVLLVAPSAASAQLEPVFVSFDAIKGTPQGELTAVDPARFGLAAGDLAAIKAKVLTILRADWPQFTFVDRKPAAGLFTTLAFGDDGDKTEGALGISDEIDFRNKRRDNLVSIVAKEHLPVGGGKVPPFTVDESAFLIGNTGSHELGHVLGQVHSDVVARFRDRGEGAAARTSIQDNELMTAVQSFDGKREFADLGFTRYGVRKQFIATAGVNVQPEDKTVAATYTFPWQGDPARKADAGATVALGTPLIFDSSRNATVVGTFTMGDSDVFTVTAKKGDIISAELFSIALNDQGGRGRISDFFVGALEIIDNAGAVIKREDYNILTDFDGAAGGGGETGDFGSDSLIFEHVFAADGVFGIRLLTATRTLKSGAELKDASGDYELFVTFVPAPGSIVVLGLGALCAARRRRA